MDLFFFDGYQKRKNTRGVRRRGLGGRAYHRPQEEVPRHEACHDDYLFEYYGENPNVGQPNYGGYYGGQQGDKALNKTKWKVLSFKGESDSNVFLDWERQVENLFMHATADGSSAPTVAAKLMPTQHLKDHALPSIVSLTLSLPV
ncbi:hypothetical protein M9H77_23360 [Catharanthus roseus]|uniref:Uncharacterized protein n=1 Tax=Catharanthus roseus TaxID=4058 RepID=A0ACC0AVM1_CATRO|nr:hypothetical protein M9H77_23360 [Catharanthus roseus]